MSIRKRPLSPETQGWLRAHKWLLARRLSQLSVLALFLAGPVTGVWLAEGNLSGSLILGVLPLTDPFLLLQSMLSGSLPVASGAVGALIVLVFYALVGGRVFCSWVCPVNPVTDLAAWLRRRLDLRGAGVLSRRLRYWLLGPVLLFPPLTGVMVWEYLNPVSMLHRGLIFGMGWAWMVILALFLFDLFVAKRGWCGHLCPMGAFYGLIGSGAVVRISAARRDQCNDCMDCFAVCPEPQVIKPVLKEGVAKGDTRRGLGMDRHFQRRSAVENERIGNSPFSDSPVAKPRDGLLRHPSKGAADGVGPVITDRHCTNCGRCIDVCSRNVFRFATRLHNRAGSHSEIV